MLKALKDISNSNNARSPPPSKSSSSSFSSSTSSTSTRTPPSANRKHPSYDQIPCFYRPGQAKRRGADRQSALPSESEFESSVNDAGDDAKSKPLHLSNTNTTETQNQNQLQTLIHQIAKSSFLTKCEATLPTFADLALVEQLLNSLPCSQSQGQSQGHDSNPKLADSSSPSLSTPTPPEETKTNLGLTYENICHLRTLIPPSCARYFTAPFYLSLPLCPATGTVEPTLFFKTICHSICLHKTRITLSFYSSQAHTNYTPSSSSSSPSSSPSPPPPPPGTLTEQDLENYIYNLIPSLPPLGGMSFNFYPFYVFTAVRRFMFFLDLNGVCRITGVKSDNDGESNSGNGNDENSSSNSNSESGLNGGSGYSRGLSIKKIVSSSVMGELLELGMSNVNPSASNSNRDGNRDGDDDKTDASLSKMPANRNLSTNWFSLDNSLRIYRSYLLLDTDQNGMLSKSELLLYTGEKKHRPMRLTPVFVDRLFEEIATYPVSSNANANNANNTSPSANNNTNNKPNSGEMDYKTYLDFVLAMSNKRSLPSLTYMWRILDVNSQGFITEFEINYFFRDIIRILQMNNIDTPSPLDVSDEIFDMISPVTPGIITFADLVRCGCGGTVVEMLVDINGFWAYDNRESLGYDEDEEEEEEDYGEGGDHGDDGGEEREAGDLSLQVFENGEDEEGENDDDRFNHGNFKEQENERRSFDDEDEDSPEELGEELLEDEDF